MWTNVAVLALGLVMLLFARGPIADVASGFFTSMTGAEQTEPDAGDATTPRDSSVREASIQIIPAAPPVPPSAAAVDAARLRLVAAVQIALLATTHPLPDDGTTPR